MKNRQHNINSPGWLLFFYSVPAKPAGSRTKIWRKLNRIGAIKLKGAVYILPYSDEHQEILQWLISELSALGGDGAFVKTKAIEPLTQDEIIQLFNNQCTERYHKLTDKFSALERKTTQYKQNGQPGREKSLALQLNKLQRELSTIQKTDFFTSKFGVELTNRTRSIKNEIEQLTLAQRKKPQTNSIKITAQKREDYQKKTWVTRKNPFVDRMASAWLIRSFIDNQARFLFIDAGHPLPEDGDQVTYDIARGDFTHVNDLCTFEVMQIAFDLHNQALAKLSKIVHAIDLHDESRRYPEAEGVETILKGIQKTASDSDSALKKGMDVIDALYASFIT
ncbi:MAG TPA: hypothetical protein ENK96_07945 [Desulfobulbaceae bacterium]|nr:hypothetical protein [Desulfobulbaceae bacterium]